MIDLVINGIHYIEKNGIIYADGERWVDAGLFKYLLNGKLTKTKKEAFSEETFTYINRMFQED